LGVHLKLLNFQQWDLLDKGGSVPTLKKIRSSSKTIEFSKMVLLQKEEAVEFDEDVVAEAVISDAHIVKG